MNHHKIRIPHITKGLYMLGAILLASNFLAFTLLEVGSSKAFGVSEVIEQSNKQRELISAKPLTIDENLMTAAQTKAEDMAKGHYFSHNMPDGTPPWKFITDTGYQYLEAGENLAVTNEDSSTIVTGWLNSPAHRDNMLNKNFTATGIGMAPFGEYEGHKNTYVVVAFYTKPGSQQNVPVTIQPTHPAGELTILKEKGLVMPLNAINILALTLIIIGASLEILHFRHKHSYNNKKNNNLPNKLH